MVFFDYCGDVRQQTAAGCLCQVRRGQKVGEAGGGTRPL